MLVITHQLRNKSTTPKKKKHELPRDFLIHVRNNSVISIPLAYLFYPIFGLNCPSNSMHINNFADE